MKNKDVIEMLNIIKDIAHEETKLITDDNGFFIKVRKCTLLDDISKESFDFVIEQSIKAISKI